MLSAPSQQPLLECYRQPSMVSPDRDIEYGDGNTVELIEKIAR